MLSERERSRYARHLSLPEVGPEGQEKLRGGSVLIVGAGGLGSPAALYLAAAGVGHIGLVDFDHVDESNLQRQVLYDTRSLGQPKLDVASDRLTALNPGVRVSTHGSRLTSANALDILRPYDVIVDGSDNFPTRYLVSDACVFLGKPDVYGSIFRFSGQASVFRSGEGPCYRCLYSEPPPPGLVPSCEEGGVLGVVPGLIGLVQATETIKLLLGMGRTLVGRLLLVDTLQMSFREIAVPRNPDCVVCGTTPSITELIDYEEFCGTRVPAGGIDMPPVEANSRVIREHAFLLDVREPHEWSQSRIEGATLIPLRELPHRIAQLPKDREVICYCATGIRSAHAVKLLREEGFARVANLSGGIRRWVSEGLPVIT
jgi:sulfur-carrier protein adenylyltransferase/sulfurtransferase